MTASRAPVCTEYDALAPYYDAFTAASDYEAWASQVLALARRHGLRGRTLLDLACGTGKSFMPFVAHGFRVTGCDSSTAMLAEAARRAPGCRARARRRPAAAHARPLRPRHLLRRLAQLPAARGRPRRGLRRDRGEPERRRACHVRPELPAGVPHDVRPGQRERARRHGVRVAGLLQPRRRARVRRRCADRRVRAGRRRPLHARDDTPRATPFSARARRLPCSLPPDSSALPCTACSRTARSSSPPTRRSTRRSSTRRDARKEVMPRDDQEDRQAGPSDTVHHEARLMHSRLGPAPAGPSTPWR